MLPICNSPLYRGSANKPQYKGLEYIIRQCRRLKCIMENELQHILPVSPIISCGSHTCTARISCGSEPECDMLSMSPQPHMGCLCFS